jgi:uncharacterized protein YukE
MTLKVALEALRYDSAAWEGVSKEIATASDAARGLGLTETDMSWAGKATGLLDTYATLQNKVTDLLAEGARVYDSLAVTLDQVRHEYELNDERAARELKGAWEINE